MRDFIPPSSQPRLEVFSDDFRSFYDPKRDFSREEGPNLLQWLCDGRSTAVDDEERRYEGSLVLAREMAHTRMIGHRRYDNAIGLPLAETELKTIVDLASYEAFKTIRGLENGVSQLFQDQPHIRELAAAEDSEQIVIFGAMASAISHREQMRRSGGQYADHPWESTLIAELAETEAFPPGPSQQNYLIGRILRYVIYSHDELEDDMSSNELRRNATFLGENKVHMTPLVHYQLLQERGCSEEVADYAADGLLRLTKTVGKSGRLGWRDYIRELASVAPVAPRGFEGTVTLAKLSEMHHNSQVDKDPRPKRESGQSRTDFSAAKGKHSRRKKHYAWATQQLTTYGQEISGYPALVARYIGSITRADLAQHKTKTRTRLSPALEPRLLVAAYDRALSA